MKAMLKLVACTLLMLVASQAQSEEVERKRLGRCMYLGEFPQLCEFKGLKTENGALIPQSAVMTVYFADMKPQPIDVEILVHESEKKKQNISIKIGRTSYAFTHEHGDFFLYSANP